MIDYYAGSQAIAKKEKIEDLVYEAKLSSMRVTILALEVKLEDSKKLAEGLQAHHSKCPVSSCWQQLLFSYHLSGKISSS